MSLLNKHIVVIDDTHSILTFLRISLEEQGATFYGAATAAGGVALCESVHPDLVVLDLSLPDKEGFNILPRLKRIDKGRNTPVVVLTVLKNQEAMATAEELGADAYLTKPFVMDELMAVICDKLNVRWSPNLALVKPRKKPRAATETTFGEA